MRTPNISESFSESSIKAIPAVLWEVVPILNAVLSCSAIMSMTLCSQCFVFYKKPSQRKQLSFFHFSSNYFFNVMTLIQNICLHFKNAHLIQSNKLENFLRSSADYKLLCFCLLQCLATQLGPIINLMLKSYQSFIESTLTLTTSVLPEFMNSRVEVIRFTNVLYQTSHPLGPFML